MKDLQENNCVSVANSTETNSISDRGNNQSSGIFANSTTNNNVYDSVSDTGNSQNGSFLNSTAGDGLSGGGETVTVDHQQ
jgi:hypothetical protein